MAVHKVTALFEAIDKISNVAKNIGGNLTKLEGVSKKAGKAIAAGFAIGGAAVLAFGASSVKVAAEYQDQLAIMSVATKDFGVDMDTLSEAALAVGGDTRLMGVSATGAAEAITGLAKAGLSSTEVFGDLNAFMNEGAELGGALRASIDLAAATELDMVQASDLAAVALATFGGEMETETQRAEFINEALNNLVKAADASVAEVSGLAEALKNVGPTAASFGFSIQDTNTALAILSTRGIQGAEAGTALKSMMTNLMRPTNAVKDTLNELGVSLFDAQGNMKSLPIIIGDLQSAMAGMTQEQKLTNIQVLAGTFGMKAMSTLLGEGTEGWMAMEGAIDSAAGIQENAAARTNTLSGKMEALEGVIETIQIRVGTALLPVLSRFVDWASEMATARGPELVALFENVAGVLDTLVSAFIGVIEWLVSLDATQIKVIAGLALFVAGIAPAIKAIQLFRTVIAVTSNAINAMRWLMAASNTTMTASLGPLLAVAAAVVAVGVAVKALNDFNNKLKDGQEGVNQALQTWNAEAAQMVASGSSASATVSEFTGRLNDATDAMDEGGIISNIFVNELDIINDSLSQVADIALASSSSWGEYTAAIEEHNTAATDNRSKIISLAEAQERATRILENDITVATEAEAMQKVLESATVSLTQAQFEKVKATEAVATAAEQAKFAELEQGVAAEAARFQMMQVAQEYTNASQSAEELVVAEEELVAVTEEVAVIGLELDTVMGMLEAAYEVVGTSAEEVAARTQNVELAMGTTSDAVVKLNSDMQLVTSAFAEGTLSIEAYADFAEQAQAGTLDLSDAQIQGISSAMEHAAAQREAAQAADEYRLALLSQSEALKDVGAQQAAQIALSGLEEKFEAGLISLDAYEAAVISVQDTYELATPQSRALAEGITGLNDMLAEGAFAPEQYAIAVEAMRAAADAGETSVEGLFAAAEAAVGPLGEAGDAALETADDLLAIEETANRARAALENMTAQDWVVQVGVAGTLPPGAEPVAVQTGMWNVPTELLALLHPGEMVLPKNVAEAVRSGRSGGSRQEGDTIINNNFNLSYSAFQEQVGRDGAEQGMREIEVAARLRK